MGRKLTIGKIRAVVYIIAIIFQILSLVAIFTNKTLSGTVFPPYGTTAVPPVELWGLIGWQVDAFVCGILGLSGFITVGFFHFVKASSERQI
jgi:hypothetical protein